MLKKRMTNPLKIFAIFPGQGSQKVGMGKDLFDNYPEAKRLFLAAEESLGFPLSKICFEGPAEKLTLTDIAQPAILTVSIAFYKLNQRSGLTLSIAGAGHSLGEYSALVAAGAIDFIDAVKLVNKRGRYMQEAVPAGNGKMIAVLGREVNELEHIVSQVKNGIAEIANVNAPGQIVISGDVAGISEFLSILGKAKVIELPVSAPFHSSLMKHAKEKLVLDLNSIIIKQPKFPVFSNYHAMPLTDPEEIRNALALQVCGRVRWVECMHNGISQFRPDEIIEFGEGSTLTGLLKRISPKAKVSNINSLKNI